MNRLLLGAAIVCAPGAANADLSMIFVCEERYEIPDAVPFGG